MYAIPLNLFVLLQVIRRTSRTLPTLEKNSSRSRARIRCDNCMQNTVRASRSSGLRSSGGDLSPSPFGGVRPRRKGRGDGERWRFGGGERLFRFAAIGGDRFLVGSGERLRSGRSPPRDRLRRRSFERLFLDFLSFERLRRFRSFDRLFLDFLSFERLRRLRSRSRSRSLLLPPSRSLSRLRWDEASFSLCEYSTSWARDTLLRIKEKQLAMQILRKKNYRRTHTLIACGHHYLVSVHCFGLAAAMWWHYALPINSHKHRSDGLWQRSDRSML